MCSSRDSCFGSDMSQRCPIPVGNSICGETNSLEIMKEFNKLYEERMDQVDAEAGGDCSQEKIKLQQEWIKNLTQQNEMLVKAVQELEYEATERVRQLEEKLHKSAECLCEVMKKYREHDFTADLLAEPLQNISRYEDDTRNLLEFIRRVRETGTWNLDGLSFYNVAKEDLLGTHCQYANKPITGDISEGEKLLNQKEKTVCELTEKINYYNTFGDIECMAKELQTRREECHNLKQEMADMRQVLTEEVASKHDQIILLKKEIQVFEDRCVQADKQTAFKEDIIRELRKEIKQLKQQLTQEEVGKLNSTIEDLKNNLEETRLAREDQEKAHQNEIISLNVTISKLERSLKVFEEKYEKDCKICKICKGKSKVGFLESSEVQADLGGRDSHLVESLRMRECEIQSLKGKVCQLETCLNTCEERAANLQEAVTLSTNSIIELEKSEEESKTLLQQQKVTIANLQQALVQAKQETDELRRKNQENVSGLSGWSAWFGLGSPSETTSNNNNCYDERKKPSVHDI